MTSQILHDDPELTDTEPPRQHVRRKKTLQDWITTVSSLLGVIAAIGVFMGSVTDALPFVQKPSYAHDMAENDVRFQKVEASTQSLTTSMTAIQRNGLLTLQLQLQQRIDALAGTLKTLAPNSQNFYQLSVAHDEAQQQLEEIKRQLRR